MRPLFNAIGLLYQDNKDYLSAIVNYDRAIAIEPEEPENYINKASAQMSMHMYREAIKTLKNALSLDKTNLKALICTANCYASIRDFDNAEKFFQKCYKIDDKFYQIYVLPCHCFF